MTCWTETEFAHLDLGDARLNKRATTLQRATELIDWYRAGWEIEILFNVSKNGYRVEALQLGTIERLERALALFLVVAWRYRLPDAHGAHLPGSGCRMVLRCRQNSQRILAH